jgi:hypothetical protein
MPATGTKEKGRLCVQRAVDVPLRELSGICLERGRGHRMALIAIGDHAAKLARARLLGGDLGELDWRTIDIARLPGSRLPAKDSQIEAVCADGAGRVLLLQETPPRVELVDADAHRVVASIELAVDGRGDLADSWSDPKGSRGEGAALLAGGHLLIAKEKEPPALVEFGPEGAASRGLAAGGALADGDAWPIADGEHRFVALAIWRPDRALRDFCEDFSDLEIGPDGWLYLLSDQSASIARLDDLAPGGGTASLSACWRLDDVAHKPEGLAFAADGRAIVALDKRKRKNNLVLLEPPIAPPHARRASTSDRLAFPTSQSRSE